MEAIAGIQYGPIIVEPPDLSDIVTAVTSLKPGPTAAEIAAAIADVMRPDAPENDGAPALREVAEALRNLDFRMQGFGRQAYGGGAVDLSAPARNYLASEATLKDVKRGITDYEIRLDYDVRTDSNPVYVGRNQQGVPTADATWIVQKMSYDGSDRMTRVEVLGGSWDGRAALPW